MSDAPKIVVDLAASVSGIPLKWREEEGYWVIVMTDGRKYRFSKHDEDVVRQNDSLANYKPGKAVEKQPETRKHKRAEE